MIVRPFSLKEANTHVRKFHSHHAPVVGHKFSLGAWHGDTLVGAIIVGRPVSFELAKDPCTWEVTRLCTTGHKNAASFLLGRAWRAAAAMGVTRLVSYTRVDEAGTCYKAAGWHEAAKTIGRPWTKDARRQPWLPGTFEPTTEVIDRVRWEKGEAAAPRIRAPLNKFIGSTKYLWDDVANAWVVSP